MKKRLLILLLPGALLLGSCQPKATPPPLIPLSQLFDNPKISSAAISPDGLKLAFLAPEKGRLNVHVCKLAEGFGHARAVTHDEKRGIFHFFWTWDSRYILYTQDEGGNENYHIYRVDPLLDHPNAVDLTPFPGARADPLDLPRERPDEIVIGLNARDKRYFDACLMSISSGKMRVLEKNPGDVDEWVTDAHGILRAAVAQIGTEKEIRVRDGATGPFRKLARYTDEEDASVFDFGKDGSFLYVGNARGSDTLRLVKLDITTGAETLIDQDPEYDLEGPVLSSLTHELLAVSYNRDRVTYKTYDAQFAKNLEILGKVHDGEILFRSSDATEKKWIIAYNSPTDPGATYLYDQDTGRAQFLYRPRPWLKPEQLCDMKPVSYPSRDGLTLHGYLTLPKGREAKNLPLVLVVHGGPWVRDDWGYDGEVQFLANRGYAVLQVNYRGSTGYGKKFLHAGDKEWGGKMLDDLVDGAHWAVAQRLADPKRLAIYGGSYGGYATLSALAFRPEVFACGIDYVGVSNLLTFMNTIPPYWDSFRDLMYKRVGNPKTETEFLRSRSPLYAADKIRVPLFIAQGLNDPRVNHAESEQIVKVLQEQKKPVEYMVKKDEGHGFANPENRMDFYRAMEAFLAKYL